MGQLAKQQAVIYHMCAYKVTSSARIRATFWAALQAIDLRIDLIVDLLLGCRSACYLARWPAAQTGQAFTKQCILTYAE